MAPTFLGSLSVLLLLGFKAVNADHSCVPKDSAPNGSICGVTGNINVFDYYIIDIFDAPAATTVKGCADACSNSDVSCSSFYIDINEGGVCELHSATTDQTQLVADDTSDYTGYDISCFQCIDNTNITTTISTTTSETTSTESTSTTSVGTIIGTGSPFPSANQTTFTFSTATTSIPLSTGISNFNSSSGVVVSTSSIGNLSVANVIPHVSTTSPKPITTTFVEDASITSSAELTTSTVFSTTVSTITSCAPEITNCPVGSVVTQTVAVTTIVCPVTQATPAVTSIPPGFTKSTVYATQVQTITSCPATNRDCSVGSVVTKTIELYTTICPIAEASPKSVPTEITSVEAGYAISTVYATKTYTITSCAATVTNCPVGHLTTEVSSYVTQVPQSEVTAAVTVSSPVQGETLETSSVPAEVSNYVTQVPQSEVFTVTAAVSQGSASSPVQGETSETSSVPAEVTNVSAGSSSVVGSSNIPVDNTAAHLLSTLVSSVPYSKTGSSNFNTATPSSGSATSLVSSTVNTATGSTTTAPSYAVSNDAHTNKAGLMGLTAILAVLLL